VRVMCAEKRRAKTWFDRDAVSWPAGCGAVMSSPSWGLREKGTGGSLKRFGVGVSKGDGSCNRGYKGLDEVFGVIKTSSAEVGVLQFPFGAGAEELESISEKRRLLPGVENKSVFWALRGVSGGAMVICRITESVVTINSSSLLRGRSKESSSSTAVTSESVVARESCLGPESPELFEGVYCT
jgi:hypothetical protein